MNRQESHHLFKTRYTGSKSAQRLNQAIRAEIPGGDVLLDTLELVNKARLREIDNPADFARLIEDRLRQIKDAATDEIKTRYHLHPAE